MRGVNYLLNIHMTLNYIYTIINSPKNKYVSNKNIELVSF